VIFWNLKMFAWKCASSCEVKVWFQHDGGPAHWGEDVRQWLNATYPGRWIGTWRADCMASSIAGSDSD
jgi:hypothetical protein